MAGKNQDGDGLIRSRHIEHAERALSGTYRIGLSERILMDRARVDHLDWARFLSHHRDTLFSSKGHLGDVDPRIEPAILTMLMHFFLVGVESERAAARDR